MSTPDTSILHCPARAENLMDLDEHLAAAARLSRLMWLLFYEIAVGPQDSELDQRDFDAILELASIIADHSSAALHAYRNRETGHG